MRKSAQIAGLNRTIYDLGVINAKERSKQARKIEELDNKLTTLKADNEQLIEDKNILNEMLGDLKQMYELLKK